MSQAGAAYTPHEIPTQSCLLEDPSWDPNPELLAGGSLMGSERKLFVSQVTGHRFEATALGAAQRVEYLLSICVCPVSALYLPCPVSPIKAGR